MTKSEAAQIPDLQIFPDNLVEDCFYYLMAKDGKLSKEKGQEAFLRLRGMESDPCYQGAFVVARMMIKNLEKYGIPCVAWAE